MSYEGVGPTRGTPPPPPCGHVWVAVAFVSSRYETCTQASPSLRSQDSPLCHEERGRSGQGLRCHATHDTSQKNIIPSLYRRFLALKRGNKDGGFFGNFYSSEFNCTIQRSPDVAEVGNVPSSLTTTTADGPVTVTVHILITLVPVIAP